MPKGVLALVHIFVDSNHLESVAKEVANISESLDVYEVTGEYDVVALMSSRDVSSFRDLIKNKLLKIEGVRSTVTSLVLYTHKKDGKPVAE